MKTYTCSKCGDHAVGGNETLKLCAACSLIQSPQSFGPRLAALRLSRRVNDRPMTQEDLAARVGVGVTAVANWERGRREPSLAMLAAIAEVLEVPVWKLFGDGNDSKQGD